ncbi:MAG: ABC transporter substrate-binding protein [Candidatus Solibacter usitatus]|nr:ABC transporter substrate-binding protein [Candidatus Solibacter usitatus]
MRRAVLWMPLLLCAQQQPYPPIGPDHSPDTREVLRRINAAGPNEVPDLRLKQEHNYAGTSTDVEPYGGVKPYKEHFLKQMEYTGPGRAEPEPVDVKTVRIGFIGPIQSTVSIATGGKSHEEALGRKMLEGAQLAIEQANARGGYVKRGIPFELDVVNDNGLWGSTGNEVVSMAYKRPVWAILGTIDSANSHIAIRVALKAEILMMNSGDTDPTFIETNIPWTARSIGDDRQQGYLLVDYMIRKQNYRRIAIIRSSNRYGRFGVREIRDSARRLGRPIVMEMAYKVGSSDFSLQLERLREASPDAVVHWGDARESALVLNQMRKLGMNQPYFTSDRSVSPEFTGLAGANAAGVISGYPWNPDRKDPHLDQFRRAFRTRFKEEPETFAAHAYDGMNILLWAVNNAGLNRAKIRDLVATRAKPWPGITGDIPFSSVLDDMGDVFLARFDKDRWTYHSREELQIPRGSVPTRERVNRQLEGVK